MNPLNNYNNDNDEEPNPEIFSKEMFTSCEQIPSNKENILTRINKNVPKINNNHENEHNENSFPLLTQPKDIKSIDQSINRAKINTSSIYQMPSKYDNYDIQQMTFKIMKDYSQLRISKEEDFMERMKFDIYKRQIKENRVNQLVDQNKVRLAEIERIQGFNRLIEDSNRRIEAQENFELLKNKFNEDLLSPQGKKYKDEEWLEIYNERFMKYQEEINSKIVKKSKENEEEERLKEEEEIKLCKNHKASIKVINESCQRLYEESMKRKIKMEQKLSKVNYEQSLSKYKKNINNNYHFLSDTEKNSPKEKNCNHYENQQGVKTNMIHSKEKSKRTKGLVTEYNNRFDESISQNSRKELNSNGNISNCLQTKEINSNKYGNEVKKIRLIPKPQLNIIVKPNINYKKKEFNRYQEKQIEEAAIKKLNFHSLGNIPKSNEIPIKKEKSSINIVENFFTKKYKTFK